MSPNRPTFADGVPVSSLTVYRVWEHAMSHRNSDPAAAVRDCQEMVTAVCRHVLSGADRNPDPDADLRTLLRQAATTLPPPPCEEGLQAMGSLLVGFESMLACLRKYGDAAITPRQAELVVNIAGALAAFMVAESEHPSGVLALRGQ